MEVLGSLKPFSHVETDWRLTHSVSATNSCVIWQRMRFSFNGFAQGFGDSLLFLPHLLGINILFECLYDQNMETWKEKNLCWHQG